MVANCSEFDQIIKSLTKNIISEGITLFNHNDVIQILQIIIENKNNELESKYVPLLIFSIDNCQDNLPLITLPWLSMFFLRAKKSRFAAWKA